jgi:hypothetical protein
MRKWKRTCVVLTVVLLVLQIANQVRTLHRAGDAQGAPLPIDPSPAAARPGLAEDGPGAGPTLPRAEEAGPTAAAPPQSSLRRECITAYLSQAEKDSAFQK